jgi:hypothetical protein
MLTKRVGWIAIGIVCLAALSAPRPSAAVPAAGVETLRPVFSRLLGNPQVVRLNGTPGARDGAYDQIGVYAEHAAIQGLRIDQLWFRLLGVTLDPAELRRGTLKVLNIQKSAIYGKVSRASVQELLNHESAVTDVTLSADGDTTVATGTIMYSGVPTHVSMRGTFRVSGMPEIFFHLEALTVDALPMPPAVASQVEQQINPVVDLRHWPVAFGIRMFRQTDAGFVMSSQPDETLPCEACIGAPVQPKP